MSDVIHLHLKLAPVPASRPRVVKPKGRGGKARTHYRDRYAAWREAASRRLPTLMRSAMGGRPALSGPLDVALLFLIPRPARMGAGGREWHDNSQGGDIDNLTKAILDSITNSGKFFRDNAGQWWRDDGQIARVHATKLYAGSAENPGIIVAARSLSGQPPPEGDSWLPIWAW